MVVFSSSDDPNESVRLALVIETRFIPKEMPTTGFFYPARSWKVSISGDLECLFGGGWSSCMTKKRCDEKAPRPFRSLGSDARAAVDQGVFACSGGRVVLVEKTSVVVGAARSWSRAITMKTH